MSVGTTRFRSRPVVVTGASSGIGEAVADRLAGVADPLVLVGRDHARLTAVATRTGGRPVPADLTTTDGRAAVVAAAGAPALLVHAAGIGAVGPLADLPPADLDALVAIDLTAALQLTRALLPALAAARGHVVLVASVAALGVAGEAAYSAAKAGLRGFADALRLEGEVGVTTVLPGAVDTPFLARRGYDRTRPRPVSPARVAADLLHAADRGRAEVFVPRWLTLAARVHGVAPGVFTRLSRRYG